MTLKRLRGFLCLKLRLAAFKNAFSEQLFDLTVAQAANVSQYLA